MNQRTFGDMAPTLLMAWMLHLLWFGLVFIAPVVIGLIFLVDTPTDPAGWFGLIWLLPVLALGLVMSVVGPYLYLRKRGFRNAFLISFISLVLGIVLPFGSILGFLGVGYLLEMGGSQAPPQ
jgi:hypothetical protein